MANIGYATLSIIPSMRGAGTVLAAQASSAGGSAGTAAGASFAGTFKAAIKKYAPAAFAVGAAVGLYKLGQTFHDAFSVIRVETGQTGEKLEGLKRDFREVFARTPADAQSVGQAIGELNTRTGLFGKGLQELARREITLSRITKSDLGENITSTTRLFGDWSIATDRQGATLDKMFRLSQETGIGVSDLSRLMVQFGSPLRQLGLDFDFSAAMFARFEKEGVNIETVLPGMRFALKTFAKEGRKPAEALKETIARIKELGPSAEATQLAFKTFGVRAGSDLAAAIQEGRFELDELINRMNTGKDTILGAGKDISTVGGKWAIFRHQMALALEPFATTVFDAVNAAMGVIGPKLARFGQTVLRNRLVIVALTAALGIGLVAAIVAVTVALVGFVVAQIAAAAIPLAIVAAITALVVGIVWLWTNWDRVWTWMSEHKALALLIAIFGTIITGGLLPLIVAAIWVAKNWDKVWTAIKNAPRNAWAFIRQVWNGALNWFRELPGRVGAFLAQLPGRIRSALTGAATWLLETGRDVLGGMLDGLIGALPAIGAFLGELPFNLLIWLATAATWLLATGLKVTIGLLTGMINALPALASFVLSLPGRMISFTVGLANVLVSRGVELLGGLLSGAKDALPKIVTFLVELPGKMLGWLGDLAKVLIRAGVALMGGLLDGIKSGAGKVKDFLGSLPGKFLEWKPIATDHLTLIPAGRALMAGLHAGILDGIGVVEDTLTGLTSPLAPVAIPNAAVATTPGSDRAPLHVENLYAWNAREAATVLSEEAAFRRLSGVG